MIEPNENEERIEYLARVLHYLMNNTIAGSITVGYDGTTCDGMCLASDFLSELGMDESEV